MTFTQDGYCLGGSLAMLHCIIGVILCNICSILCIMGAILCNICAILCIMGAILCNMGAILCGIIGRGFPRISTDFHGFF